MDIIKAKEIIIAIADRKQQEYKESNSNYVKAQLAQHTIAIYEVLNTIMLEELIESKQNRTQEIKIPEID